MASIPGLALALYYSFWSFQANLEVPSPKNTAAHDRNRHESTLQSKRQRIRALVPLNAAVCSASTPDLLHSLVRLGLEDPDPMVQEASVQAVEKLTGNVFDRNQTPIKVVRKVSMAF